MHTDGIDVEECITLLQFEWLHPLYEHLVREIAHHLKEDLRFQAAAIDMLQLTITPLHKATAPFSPLITR
ncbi:hypothetical protein KIN20_022749 [Parelaphostrongylus tenuis]|uniref:Uncharacterized protein n=1 Tax=Parelaphostrongylus tenuis TaxID=148309 RepID=A0AAD5MQQ0_PARTN|nr:hypothetical protein KIN20_022749 [Parelaphostrongylus tenuis]